MIFTKPIEIPDADIDDTIQVIINNYGYKPTITETIETTIPAVIKDGVVVEEERVEETTIEVENTESPIDFLFKHVVSNVAHSVQVLRRKAILKQAEDAIDASTIEAKLNVIISE